MKVLGLIPARGGSKGVPRKNIRLLCGKPLLAYTAEAALLATRLTKIVLSTEDAEIAAVGRECGIEVPFLRPAELAQDDTPTLPVVQHALGWYEERGEKFDAVCLLQPTNPLRRAADIDNCVDLLEQTDAEAIVSVKEVPHEFNPKWVYWLDENGKLALSTGDDAPVARRQDLPTAFHRDGSLYVVRRDVVMQQNSLYGSNLRAYEINSEYSANIDTLADWQAVEQKISGAV